MKLEPRTARVLDLAATSQSRMLPITAHGIVARSRAPKIHYKIACKELDMLELNGFIRELPREWQARVFILTQLGWKTTSVPKPPEVE